MKNIAIIGFDEKHSNNIASQLADALDKYVLDVSKAISYHLFDSKLMYDVCGKAYFNEQEAKVLRTLAEYDDTIFVLSFDLFAKFIHYVKNVNIFYIRTTEKRAESLAKHSENHHTNSKYVQYYLQFEEFDKLATENSTHIFEGHSDKIVVAQIIDLLSKGDAQ